VYVNGAQKRNGTSAAMPMTIVITWPGPLLNILEHDFLFMKQMSKARRMLLFTDMGNLVVSMSRWGAMQGKLRENLVP